MPFQDLTKRRKKQATRTKIIAHPGDALFQRPSDSRDEILKKTTPPANLQSEDQYISPRRECHETKRADRRMPGAGDCRHPLAAFGAGMVQAAARKSAIYRGKQSDSGTSARALRPALGGRNQEFVPHRRSRHQLPI